MFNRFASCALAVIAAMLMHSPAQAERPVIAIIIDDIGYELAAGRRVIELPGPVACAVLPGTPRGRILAEAANSAGKEVLLHLPLQPVSNNYRGEPGSMLLDMSRAQFAEAFTANLDAVPHVAGINTHRGSLLTRHPGHMRWLMEEIAAHGNLFFVDSFTTHESVALPIALDVGLRATKRDVFLDPDDDPQTVEREFRRLKDRAQAVGHALGIGHPYPATLALLERELPKLKDEGFDLVSVKTLLSRRSLNQMAGIRSNRQSK